MMTSKLKCYHNFFTHIKIIFFFFRSEIEDVDLFPKLSKYLQLASSTTSQNDRDSPEPQLLIDIKQSPPSTPTPSELTPQPSSPTPPPLLTKIPPPLISPSKIISSIPPGTQLKIVMSTATTIPSTNSTITTATTTTSSSSQVTTANSKISLVPTNYLMKPQHQQTTNVVTSTATAISFNQQLFGAAAGKSIANVAGQTVYTTTNGGVPMKVLLVNALQKPTPTAVSNSGVNVGGANAPMQIMPKKTATIPAHVTRSTTAAAASAASMTNHLGQQSGINAGVNSGGIMLVDANSYRPSNLMNVVTGGTSNNVNNEYNIKVNDVRNGSEFKQQRGMRNILYKMFKIH